MYYNDAAFWTSLFTFFGGLFGIIKIYFDRQDKTNIQKAKLDMSVENIKKGNIEQSAFILGDTISKTQSMAAEAQFGVEELKKAMHQNAVIQDGLSKMIKQLTAENQGLRSEVELLKHQSEDFNGKFRAGTASLQLCVDRVELIRREFGKVLVKP